MKEKDVILLNNLFNGEYIKESIGGEIINMYQSDNDKYYVYINPYGNVSQKWDDRIKYILFIRSIGNRVVKVIAKAEVEEQISINVKRKTASQIKKQININGGHEIDKYQKKYIDEEKITYSKIKIYEFDRWSSHFITFKVKGIFKAKKNIYLSSNETKDQIDNFLVLENVKAINNQSQKLYITPSNSNYFQLKELFENPNFWEFDPVGKVNLTIDNNKTESFLSIIKKEDDELVNSNLLAYFLENDKLFWADFAVKILKISSELILNELPKITRESTGNIDLFIEVGNYMIVIENKIKSAISGSKKDGYSQLKKYVEVAEKEAEGKNKKLLFFILRPNYNNEDYGMYIHGNKYIEIKYSSIYEIIKDRELGLYFDEFKKVVKKHSAEYDNELFEIMNERFIDQIKSKSKSHGKRRIKKHN